MNHLRVNDRIRFSPVVVIDQNGKNLGSIPIDEAKRLARNVELDLVEVAPQARPPVCRIMDYGKHLYEQNKKQKKSSKKIQLKELRLSPNIGKHDLETKINQLKRFIDEGDDVQLKVVFSGRENAHRDLGFSLVNEILQNVSEMVTVQRPPKMEGKFLTCLIRSKNEKNTE